MPTDDAYRFRLEGREYVLDRLMMPEAKVLQKTTGKTVAQFFQALTIDRDVDCLQALVWVLRKREEPTLKLEDVDGDLMTFDEITSNDEDEPRAEGNAPVDPPEPL